MLRPLCAKPPIKWLKRRDLDALFRATKGTVKAEAAATIMLSLKQSRVPKKKLKDTFKIFLQVIKENPYPDKNL